MPPLDITQTYLFLNAFASPFCDPGPLAGAGSSVSPEPPLSTPNPPNPPQNTPATPDLGRGLGTSSSAGREAGSPLAKTVNGATGYVAGDPRGEIPDDRSKGCETSGMGSVDGRGMARLLEEDAAALSTLASLLASSTAAAAASLPSSAPTNLADLTDLASAPPFAHLSNSGSSGANMLGVGTGATGTTATGSGSGTGTGTGSGSASPAAMTLANLPTPPRMPVFATCNCGNVRVTVRKEPGYLVVCQCACCRRFSGGLAAHLASFAEADITTTGPLRGHWRGRLLREFCASCGCAVRLNVGGQMLMSAGLLPPGVVENVPWMLGFCGGD